MLTQNRANRHVCWRIRTPGIREARKETGFESQPRPPPEPPGLTFPPGGGIPPLSSRSGPPPGPRPGLLSPVAEVLCGVNGASAKAGAGRELSPGCGNPAVGPREGLAFVCGDPRAGAHSHGDRPRRCAEAGQPRALPRGGGVRLLNEARAGPCPLLPGNPGGEWSELIREERLPCGAQRITQSGDTHSSAPPRCLLGRVRVVTLQGNG